MTDEEATRALRIARTQNVTGLLLILVAGVGLVFTSFAAIGWWTIPLGACLALGWLGWWLATRDASPGTAGTRPGTTAGSPGGTGPGIEIDTDNLDPGQFIPGRGDLGPGEFYPPPPSRDSSRDFDRDSSRDTT